ncbi:MED19 [Lepeophtheirus salmonis]|uniref:Mediator of RNA polymerase II transcription subunit 19 n=1 Tax=Lepeophtheirus salmonis TaxID=72036 RepID=A0A7R8D372_LEPSM|nr:MED19 [Lepeophtheirus salmonis]CAF3009666.1 MED19 [Lepeophtheirus salmonis]
MISRAMNEDYITVEVLGSDYENQWDLLAGVYKFRVSTFLKSLVFESKEKRVTIDRSLIKDYGIRSINKRKYYFFCLGSRSPFGKGEIILNSFDFDLDEFNNYVRTHIKTTSKALSLHANKSLSLKRSVSRKNGRIKSRTSSESDVTKQVSNLSKLFSKLFKSKKDRKKKLLKDRDSLTSKEDYSVVDEYSEILPSGYSGQTYLCTSEDLSDSESMGLVLPSPDFKTKSCKSFKKKNPKNHLKWHEQNENLLRPAKICLFTKERKNYGLLSGSLGLGEGFQRSLLRLLDLGYRVRRELTLLVSVSLLLSRVFLFYNPEIDITLEILEEEVEEDYNNSVSGPARGSRSPIVSGMNIAGSESLKLSIALSGQKPTIIQKGPFYLMKQEHTLSNEITGATNLMASKGLEHSYSKLTAKKMKNSLSSFLQNLPGIVDTPGSQDNSSLRGIIEKPPVCGKELMPLNQLQLAGFRLHPGPLPEQYSCLTPNCIQKEAKA